MDWQTAELSGYAYYSRLGYRIFVPLVSNQGYDFIAEKDGTFLRVNVKVAGLKDRASRTSWSISVASGSNTSIGKRHDIKCDVFLVYLPATGNFIELPGSFFATGNSKSKLIPKHLLKDQ
jgi:hypothetical protein